MPRLRLAPGAPTAATGRPAEALATLATIDESRRDGHHAFHLGESYIMAGAHERGIALIDKAIDMGFYTGAYLERLCPFHAAVRDRDDFRRVVEHARRRAAEFAAALG